jgi:hypothetical protein
MMRRFGVLFAVTLSLSLVVWLDPAQANHQWGQYHWQHTQNPLGVTLIDSTTNSPTAWSTMLSGAAHDWETPTNGKTSVLNTTVTTGSKDATTRQNCPPESGKVRVCNYDYGNTGWLGVAQIWIYIGKGKHIAQGTVENNDYYFTGAGGSGYAYNNTAEEQHVICQEVGHTFGLDHQSEDGSTLDTCMDYYHNRSSTDTQSTEPNAGDYDELLCVYDPAYKGVTLSSTTTWTDTYDRTSRSSTHTCTGTGHFDTSKKPGGGPGGGPPPGGGPAHNGKPTVIVSQAGDFWLVTFIYWND